MSLAFRPGRPMATGRRSDCSTEGALRAKGMSSRTSHEAETAPASVVQAMRTIGCGQPNRHDLGKLGKENGVGLGPAGMQVPS